MAASTSTSPASALPNADALAERFGLLVGRAVGADRTIELDGGTVRVVAEPDGSPDQLTAVEMHATDRGRAGETVVISGTEIRLI